MSTAASANAISVRGLVKRYGSHTAVAGVSFDVPSGQVTALFGPNGAGKTTTDTLTLAGPGAGEMEPRIRKGTSPCSSRSCSTRHVTSPACAT